MGLGESEVSGKCSSELYHTYHIHRSVFVGGACTRYLCCVFKLRRKLSENVLYVQCYLSKMRHRGKRFACRIIDKHDSAVIFLTHCHTDTQSDNCIDLNALSSLLSWSWLTPTTSPPSLLTVHPSLQAISRLKHIRVPMDYQRRRYIPSRLSYSFVQRTYRIADFNQLEDGE